MSARVGVERQPGAARTIDYDLHGLVGIRLVDASPRDEARVTAQLGPLQGALGREPDITIRFVDALPLRSPVRLVGYRDAAFTDEAFLILRGSHKARVRVQIPFDSIGHGCEIVCEHGAPAIPLLLGIINLTVLARGGLALHASAFRYGDRGVLVTGWAKGGKTELLLGFVAAGADYIGDEWIYLDPSAERMFGIPEPVRIWDWQLGQFPRLARWVSPAGRLRLRSLRWLSTALTAASGDGQRDLPSWRLRLGAAADLVERQRYVRLSPHDVFGRARVVGGAQLDTVVLVLSQERPGVMLRRTTPQQVAARMAVSLQEERHDLVAAYRRFRFAHPDRSSSLLEGADELERGRLQRALRGRDCFLLSHPYPPTISTLVAALKPELERGLP